MAAAGDLLDIARRRLDLAVVRLALQGPLGEELPGIAFNPTTNKFYASTPVGMAALYEAVLENADSQPDVTAYLHEWSDLIDVIAADFDRGGDSLVVTNGYLFQHMAAGWEMAQPSISLQDAAGALGIDINTVILGPGGTLTGTADPDLFYLDHDGQVAQGGLSIDSYVVGRGFGSVTVDDYEGPLGAQDEDWLRMARANPDEVTLTRDGVDLIVTISATGDQVRVLGQFTGVKPSLFGDNLNPDRGVRGITFANGETWEAPEIAKAVSHPTAGADTITGTFTIDYLDGGAGNDTLSGGDGMEFYVFGRGYGADQIQENQTYLLVDDPDVLYFTPDTDLEDLRFARGASLDDLVISIAGTSDSVTIQGQFAATYTGIFDTVFFNRVEDFTFDDGFSFDYQTVMDVLLAQAKTDGNDAVYGFSAEDTLDGGLGDDLLSGGNENDNYIYDLGYGHDTIDENETNILGGEVDHVRFGAGINPANVAISRPDNTNDLLLTFSDGGTLRIQGEFDALDTGPFGVRWFDRVERFNFQDVAQTEWNVVDVMNWLIQGQQTAGDDHVRGYNWQDTLDGGAGNDLLEGDFDGDTYVFGRGYDHDTIKDDDVKFSNEVYDVVEFKADVAPGDIQFERHLADDDLTMRIAGTNDLLTIQNFDGWNPVGHTQTIHDFKFANGTDWTAADIRQMWVAAADTPGDDVIYATNWDDVVEGGAGNDTINALVGDDLITGGTGNDTLLGGFGQDVYVYNAGDGADVISDMTIFSGEVDELRCASTLAWISAISSMLGRWTTLATLSSRSTIRSAAFGSTIKPARRALACAMASSSLSSPAACRRRGGSCGRPMRRRQRRAATISSTARRETSTAK